MGKSKEHSSRAAELEKQRQTQAAKRAERRAKKDRTITPRPLKALDSVIVPLVMVLRTDKATGYEALRRNTVLRLYARRYKYEEHWQLSTMRGSFEIEVPFLIAKQIEAELAPHWSKGKLATDEEAD